MRGSSNCQACPAILVKDQQQRREYAVSGGRQPLEQGESRIGGSLHRFYIVNL